MKDVHITAAMLARFAQALQEAEKSGATVEKYLRDVRKFAAWLEGRAVSKRLIVEYKEQLGREYAVASANSMLASIHALLRFCGRMDMSVRQFRVQRQAYLPEKRELSRAEYQRLVQAARQQGKGRLCCLLQTICATGMRVSEVQFITVEAVRQGEALVQCKGKRRRVFLVEHLRRLLKRYIREQGLTEGPVFRTRRGKPLGRTAIWREMKALCRAARVLPEKVFPHNLRHLFARIFYGMEKDIAKLADILGHSSINTTRIYIASSGAEHRQRMESMHLIL
ncbi:MAG: tyrosine-type recombinase/integrase [Clostridia bacterium]|nr:tyrosine-type recombinase/integrase [Clostridia bacterium]MBQ8506242.1 tyrosine-type recombinase/integrase [Clostridia bacterium]